MADATYKYLDATNQLSDPASTSLLYVDARHEFTDAATVDILRLDATNNWSHAVVGKVITAAQVAAAPWVDVARTAREAAKNPQGYADFVGKTKTLTASDGKTTYNLTARIDGVGQDTLQSGATGGFTFEVVKGLPHVVFNTVEHYAEPLTPQNSAYDTSDLRRFLESLEWDADLRPFMRTFAVKFRRPAVQDPVDPARPDQWAWKPPTAAETIYAKVAPLSMANYWDSSSAADFSDVVFADEGPLYDYFKGVGRFDAKRYILDDKGAGNGGFPSVGAYTLTPHTMGFVGINNPQGGPSVLSDAWDVRHDDEEADVHTSWKVFGTTCRFVLGSSA